MSDSFEEACAEVRNDLRIDSLTAENARLAEELRAARAVVANLMPFVLEDYHPTCATPEYKAAVEAAQSLNAARAGEEG